MTRNVLKRLALAFSLVVTSISSYAHHGGSSLYDLHKAITVKGTITDFLWTNPHCEVFFDVKDSSGTVQHWTLEGHPPNILITHHWTRKSLNPGDEVTITFNPGRNGATVGRLITVVLANGQQLVQD